MDNSDVLSRRNWIFDLDGTLTVPKHDFAHIRQVLGIPDDKDILGYLAEVPEERGALLRAELNDIGSRIAHDTEAADGVANLLRCLSRRDVRMGILTRNTRHHAMVSLEAIGLLDYFAPDTILGRDEAAPKPAPEGIRKLLAAWQAHATDAVMVGDYLFDLQTGRAADVGTVHVDETGQYPWPGMTDLGVRSLVELRARIPQ